MMKRKRPSLVILATTILLCARSGAAEGADANRADGLWWLRPPYSTFGETIDSADLIVVGKVIDSYHGELPGPQRWIPRQNPEPVDFFWRVEVKYVLKGTAQPGTVIDLWAQMGSWTLPLSKGRDEGREIIVGLRRISAGFYVATGCMLSFETSQQISLPEKADWRDKLTILAIDAIETGDETRAKLALGRLEPNWARPDSPYYKVFDVLERVEHTSPSLARETVPIRLRWGESSALKDAIELTRRGERVLLEFDQVKSEDALTTLNLILEGKRWPWMNDYRVAVVEHLRTLAQPASMPYLVRALDDPDRRIQFYSCTAIRKIRGLGMGPSARAFLYSMELEPDSPLTAMGYEKVAEAKHWWAAEGNRRFARELPDVK